MTLLQLEPHISYNLFVTVGNMLYHGNGRDGPAVVARLVAQCGVERLTKVFEQLLPPARRHIFAECRDLGQVLEVHLLILR